MKILPITSLDIVGRYISKDNKLIDTFTNSVLYQGEKAYSLASVCENIGLLNSHIIQYNSTHKNNPVRLLDVTI